MTSFPCINPAHDHSDDDGPMRCEDCDEPMHYDTEVEWYVHDDPKASCFLIQTHPEGASACDRRTVKQRDRVRRMKNARRTLGY